MNARSAIIDSMAQLLVRNLDEDIVVRLRLQAAKNGRSAEEEHREILRAALLPARKYPSFKEHLLALPEGLTDADLARQKDLPRKVDL
jgi:antitoxin FitA